MVWNDHTYILRIYQQSDFDDPTSVVGVLEVVHSGKRVQFSNKNELWQMLTEIYKNKN